MAQERCRRHPKVACGEHDVTNYFGLSAISVPCGVDSRGLPIGMQIIGKPGDDATVIRLAHDYESARRTASMAG